MRAQYVLILVGTLLLTLILGCAAPPPTTEAAPVETSVAVVETEVVLSARSPMSVVHTLAWLDDGTLRYASASGESTEPKDWQWRTYDPTSGSTHITTPPRSSIPTSVREELGLCTRPEIECWRETRLYESPSGSQVVYAPPGSTGEFGSGELWYAKTDGSERRRIQGQIVPGAVTWSPKEDYFLVDVGRDFPDPMIVDTQSLTAKRVLDISALEICLQPYAAAKFDPRGDHLVFTARRKGEDACQLWQVEPTGANLEFITDVWGSVSWSNNAQTLYVLREREGMPPERRLILYEIDLTGEEKEAVLLSDALPYYGFLTGNFVWAVAPDEGAIAYLDAAAQDGVYVVHFACPFESCTTLVTAHVPVESLATRTADKVATALPQPTVTEHPHPTLPSPETELGETSSREQIYAYYENFLETPVLTECWSAALTQLEMNRCSVLQEEQSHRMLQEFLEEQLIYDAFTAEERGALLDVQRDWEAFRQKDCERVWSVYGNGTIGPMNYRLCLDVHNRHRLRQLLGEAIAWTGR